MDQINFTVVGVPMAQPRPRACKAGDHFRIYTPRSADPWKKQIMQQAEQHAPPEPIAGAVTLYVGFFLPRPAGHFVGARFSGAVRAAAPVEHEAKPDLDNLIKPVMDCMTELGFWHDDTQVNGFVSFKRYVDDLDAVPGARVSVLKSRDGIDCSYLTPITREGE